MTKRAIFGFRGCSSSVTGRTDPFKIGLHFVNVLILRIAGPTVFPHRHSARICPIDFVSVVLPTPLCRNTMVEDGSCQISIASCLYHVQSLFSPFAWIIVIPVRVSY
jgi:hypothetical protein